jgi:STAM-binding protein
MRLDHGQIGTLVSILWVPSLTDEQARNVFTAMTLLIPKQTATSDTCATTNEEDIFAISDSRDLIVLGWVSSRNRPPLTFPDSRRIDTHASASDLLPEQC